MGKLTNMKLLQNQIMFYENNLSRLSPKEIEELETLKMKLNQSKKGKGAKIKGASYERTIAKIFKKYLKIDLARTPQSGGFAKKSEKAEEFRGDIVCLDNEIDFKLHIECKNQKVWKLRDWLEQAKSDCPKTKIPCVIFHQPQIIKDGKVTGKSDELITMRLEDFLKVVNHKKIIER